MTDVTVSLSQRFKQLATTASDREAVTCGNETLTYAELHRRTNIVARGLLAAGVKLGDLVTVGLPNGIGFVEACWGLWKIGATPQPVSFRLPLAELKAIAELAETPIVIADFDYELGRPILGLSALSALSTDDSDLPDAISPVLKAPTSGGSTGRAKLILSGGPGTVPSNITELWAWRMTDQTVALLPAPLYHNAGFGMMMLGLLVGAHVVILPRFDAEETLAAVERHRATWIYLVPTMMSRIWRLPETVRARYDVSSLEVLWHLAAPCPAWLKEAFIEWLGAETILEMYAGTESQSSTVITGTEWLVHRGSVGKVTRGEMQAFGEENQPLPPGEIGEIYMRRDSGVPPTYEYRGATAKTLPGGWESLGDIGWFDEDGYLYLADRRTDMILVGGSNIYPAEIEAALEEHPLVQSCAVIGLPDDDLGNLIHAIIQPRASIDAKDLDQHLAERLVAYKRPRSYEFVDEALRDDAGKVRRSALREERLDSVKSAAS